MVEGADADFGVASDAELPDAYRYSYVPTSCSLRLPHLCHHAAHGKLTKVTVRGILTVSVMVAHNQEPFLAQGSLTGTVVQGHTLPTTV